MSVPTDDRAFVRVSVDLPSNPKIVDATAAVKWLYATGFCVAGRDLNDGIVRPTVVVAEADVPSSAAKQLVKRGLWHAPGHDCDRCPQPPKGHVVIHDYLLHNRSKAEADEQRKAKSAAGRKGAAARWGSGGGNGSSHSTSHSSSHSRTDATSIAESESEGESEGYPQGTSVSHLPTASREISDDGLTKIQALTKGTKAHARRCVELVLSKATSDVRNVERYVLAAIRTEPELYAFKRGNPKKGEECPTHAGQWLDACNGCAADAKAAGA